MLLHLVIYFVTNILVFPIVFSHQKETCFFLSVICFIFYFRCVCVCVCVNLQMFSFYVKIQKDSFTIILSFPLKKFKINLRFDSMYHGYGKVFLFGCLFIFIYMCVYTSNYLFFITSLNFYYFCKFCLYARIPFKKAPFKTYHFDLNS